MELKRKELSNDVQGIVDGHNIYSRKELYEKDGYLCTFVINDRELKSVEDYQD